MPDSRTHSFVSLECFTNVPIRPSIYSTNNISLVGHAPSTSASLSEYVKRPLSEGSWIVRRVNDYVWGHASFGDMRTLLQRNNVCNSDVQRLFWNLVKTFEHCIASSAPISDRRISIAGINSGFNDVFCDYHFHLDEIRMFHGMDSYYRLSAALSLFSATLSDAIAAFESAWVSQFLPTYSVQGEVDFRHNEFIDYLSQYSTQFVPFRHVVIIKNVPESKNAVIRAIFFRLKSASLSSDQYVFAA